MIKRILTALLAAVLLFTLSGCSNSVSEVESDAGELPTMGNIYLTTDGNDPWEYTQAQIAADWDNSMLAKQSVAIKLRGNSSTQTEKKSYNIKFTEKQNFMGIGQGKKWCLLANPYDKSLLRISLAFEYAQALGLPYVPDFRLCKLWLNDEYRGIYIVMEPIGDGADRIDIDVQAGDAIFERDVDRTDEGKTYITAPGNMRFQINEPETPTAEQLENYADFLSAVYDAVQTHDHTVYEKLIDVDSFVNFYIFEEVVKDIDFGTFSTRYFIQDGKLYAGPPWDLDLSMGNVSQVYWEEKYSLYHNKMGYGTESRDSTEGLWVQGDYYAALTQDEYFMELVRARWQEIKPVTDNLVQDNDLGKSRLDLYLETYEEELRSNYSEDGAGWTVWLQYGEYADQSIPIDYDGNVEELREWLTKRIAWLDMQFGTVEK